MPLFSVNIGQCRPEHASAWLCPVTAGCHTSHFLWQFSADSAEEFVLFCDFAESERPRFHRREPVSPARGPARPPCQRPGLSEAQWYRQAGAGGALQEITGKQSHLLLDKTALRFLTADRSHEGSYVCRPRPRYVHSILI